VSDGPLGELDSALRGDIRRIGVQLGDTLVRQHGPGLLERVEQVRGLARGLRRSDEDSTAMAELLADVDVAEAGLLARAFTVYFHLANTAEQVHRIDDLTEKRAAGSNRFGEMVGRLREMGYADDEIVATVNSAELRPVFTAHPTEASRRSILDKLAEISSLIEQRAHAGADDTARRRVDRRVDDAELERRRVAEGQREGGWRPGIRQRQVSAALQAYAAMATSADKGAVRDVDRLGL